MGSAAIPMFGPDGQRYNIPSDQVDAFVRQGGEIGHDMTGPDGKAYQIPTSKMGEALRQGMIPASAKAELPSGLQNPPGVINRFLTAAGAALSPEPLQSKTMMGQFHEVYGNPQTGQPMRNPLPSPSDWYNLAKSIGSRMSSGDVAGGLGEAMPAALQGLLLAKGILKRPPGAEATMPPKAQPQPLTPTESARGITRAVNPPVNEWNAYIDALSNESGNVKAFAEQQGLPLKTQLDWANAAKAAAQQKQGIYRQLLEPHSNEVVNVPRNSPIAQGEGATARLGQVEARIDTINDLLRNIAKQKESGQVLTGLANEADLVAEGSALRDVLYSELSQRTGVPQEVIKQMRQSYGRMYQISDSTLSAVNQRQSSMGKASEGRRDIPVTMGQTMVSGFNVLRGGPEGIGNRAFRRAMAKSTIPPK